MLLCGCQKGSGGLGQTLRLGGTSVLPGEMSPTAGLEHHYLQRGGEEASDLKGNIILPTPALGPTLDSFDIIPFLAGGIWTGVLGRCCSPAPPLLAPRGGAGAGRAAPAPGPALVAAALALFTLQPRLWLEFVKGSG